MRLKKMCRVITIFCNRRMNEDYQWALLSYLKMQPYINRNEKKNNGIGGVRLEQFTLKYELTFNIKF